MAPAAIAAGACFVDATDVENLRFIPINTKVFLFRLSFFEAFYNITVSFLLKSTKYIVL